MWKIIQELLPAVLVILFITQLAIPIIFNGTTWWLFRKEKKQESSKVDQQALVDELKTTKAKIDDAKAKVDEVKNKVEGNLKSAEDLKKEADKLL